MGKYASEVVKQAKAWLGKKESNGSHREIIDVYNSHKPLARGYKVKYTDEWCSTFVSAVSIKLGYTDIIPTECGCGKHIELFKKLGSWVENENRTPKAGDIIFYDWDDNGSGDNKGGSDHVGIVEKVSNGTITVIEGNKGEAVARRTLKVNGKYIRGYGVPKYDKEKTTTTTSKETEKDRIKDLKKALNKDFNCKLEINGKIDSKLTNAVMSHYLKNFTKGNFVKWTQTQLKRKGYDLGSYGIDGGYGTDTEKAVKKYQKDKGLTVDGCVGIATVKSLVK